MAERIERINVNEGSISIHTGLTNADKEGIASIVGRNTGIY